MSKQSKLILDILENSSTYLSAIEIFQKAREVISNKVNGLLFEVNSIEQLSKAMEDSLNPDIYTKLVNGVSDFQNQYPAYSWSCIAEQYINLK